MNLRTTLLNRWDVVRNSYWFVPSLMALGSLVLSYCTLHIDTLLAKNGMKDLWWVYTGSASGARAVLQTIATSMIGLAGVVFSITTVTLTLAANKFGPRIFRNFVGDIGNQVVLGTFTSTFLFCVLVLRQVRGADGDYDRFIPQVSMLVAVTLAMWGLGVLIYFIHHVAASIQTGNVIANICDDLLTQICSLYPEQIGQPVPEEAESLMAQFPAAFGEESVAVRAGLGGYLRRVEANTLLRIAEDHDLVIQVERHPGDFVAARDVVLRVWPRERMEEAVGGSLKSAFVIGGQRTSAQDVRFALGQLLEISALALSPGVNDLYTAVMCVDRIGEGLAFLAVRTIPSPYRADKEGRLRVVAPPPDLPELLADSCRVLRGNGAGQPMVMTRLLEALARIAGEAHRAKDRAAVLSEAELIREAVAEVSLAGPDKDPLDRAFENVMRVLARVPSDARSNSTKPTHEARHSTATSPAYDTPGEKA